jgi:hypothetical protein
MLLRFIVSEGGIEAK